MPDQLQRLILSFGPMQIDMEFKSALIQLCMEKAQSKVDRLNGMLEDLQQDSLSETKRTAGDKHETGRAMLHLEREKLAGQQTAAVADLTGLKAIDFEKVSNNVQPGSLIETDRGLFLLAVSLGKIKLKDREVVVLSPASPLGRLFINEQQGSRISFRQLSYSILYIY